MQLAQAVADGILIPVDKAQTESFKTGEELLTVDKGGLVFQPEPGVHEGAGELDFASMYPAIMVGHNLSPETVGCPCCREDGDLIPETGLRSCRKRQGLIPRVLAPLLVKRARYKELKRSAPTEAGRARAKARVSAHKWLLVCSFGYLGYRNARFGRIEAHEATTAWGREALLRAKEAAEDLGYRMIHGIVDSLWVEKPAGPVTAAECEVLAAEIERRSGLPIAVEGVYRWIAFLPSTADERRGVAQRYLGVFESGEVKARGIEARRVDTAPFVRAMQTGLVEELAKAASVAEARVIAEGLVDRVREAAETIRSGRLRGPDLAIHRHLSKGPLEYARPTPVAVAAQQLVSRGATLEAGEKIAYVLGPDRPLALQVREGWEPYDAEAYVALALRAAATVLAPFGWPLASLQALLQPVRLPPEPSVRRAGNLRRHDVPGQMTLWG
jgi:DNA polymerase-2